jgi:hypothetical protein
MSLFTDLVRKYAERTLTAEEFHACLRVLAGVIRSRLERLGMLHQPPEYFDYPEFDTWESALSLAHGPNDVHLDAFDHAITDKLDLYAERLETSLMSNIDGLVRLNIGHFLFERQRRHDPVGYAVFENLEAALLSLRDAEKIAIDNMIDATVRNPSLIRFRPTSTDLPSAPEAVRSALAGLPELDRLLPQLARTSSKAQAVLADLLPGLAGAGIHVCLFRDLVGTLKESVSAAYQAWNRPDENTLIARPRLDGQPAELIRIVQPDSSYLESEQHVRLLA